MNKIKKIFLLSIFISALSSPLFFAHAQDNTAPDLGASTPKISPVIDFPKLSVHLPGLNFDKSVCKDNECSNNWLAEYIKALYQYGIGIIGILAVITMMIGGIVWLTAAGNSERVGEAKKWIGGSIFGVFIAFTSYLILEFVNPALTALSPIKIAYVDRIDLDRLDSPDAGNELPSGSSDASCLGTGDISQMGSIVKKYLGNKVTYRYGAYGGTGIPYKSRPTVCPPGQICFDCSNFIRHIFSCVGKTGPSGTTADIFSGQEKMNSATSTSVNGRELKPGDLVGWPKIGTGNNGHVILYIGNGEVGEVHGGSGWNGDAARVSSFIDYYNKYSGKKDLRIRRIN